MRPHGRVALLAQLMANPVHPGINAEEDAARADQGCRNNARVRVPERAFFQIDVVGDGSCCLQQDQATERQAGAGGVDHAPAQVQERICEDQPKHVGEGSQPRDAAEEVDHGGVEPDLRRQHEILSQADRTHAWQERDRPPIDEKECDLRYQDQKEWDGHRNVEQPQREPEGHEDKDHHETGERLWRLLPFFGLQPAELFC